MDRTLCPDPFHDGEDYLNEVFSEHKSAMI